MSGLRRKAKTVLAPPTERRHLQEIIAGVSEGVILIEPDGRLIRANAAALKMHQVDSVEALGATVDEYRRRFALRFRNRHPLKKRAYPMDRLVAGETYTDIVVELLTRHRHAETRRPIAVLGCRGLILLDASDRPDALALMMDDLTERYAAEERFERTFNANPAPAVICRLSDQRYIKVNQGFADMTGYVREEVMGRSVYEVDVLEAVEDRELAIGRLQEGRTIPQMEACLRLPGGGTKFVVVAGQPLDVNGEPSMLFTFMDLQPRKLAEFALRQSEERFSKAFRLSPVPTTLTAIQGFRFLDVNEAFLTMSGYSTEEATGSSATDLGLWSDPQALQRIENALANSGGCRNVEMQMRTRDGSVCECLVSAEAVTIAGQACALFVLQDITQRKRSELELMSAIEAVMKDTSWFSRTVVEKLANLRRGESAAPTIGAEDLTSREREVLGLIGQGLRDADIAGRLGLARNTVRNHIAALYEKIEAHSRGEAIIWARERGISDGGEAGFKATAKAAKSR